MNIFRNFAETKFLPVSLRAGILYPGTCESPLPMGIVVLVILATQVLISALVSMNPSVGISLYALVTLLLIQFFTDFTSMCQIQPITQVHLSYRLDSTLVDFSDMRWERGDVTFLFDGEAPPHDALIVLDNKLHVYQKIRYEVPFSLFCNCRYLSKSSFSKVSFHKPLLIFVDWFYY